MVNETDKSKLGNNDKERSSNTVSLYWLIAVFFSGIILFSLAQLEMIPHHLFRPIVYISAVLSVIAALQNPILDFLNKHHVPLGRIPSIFIGICILGGFGVAAQNSLQKQKLYVSGNIVSDYAVERVIGSAKNPFIIAPRSIAAGSDLPFIIMEDQLNTAHLKFNFKLHNTPDIVEIYISCVETSVAKSWLGSRYNWDLKLEKDASEKPSLIDTQTSTEVGLFGNFRNCDKRPKSDKNQTSIGGLLFSNAYADEEPPATVPIEESIRNLTVSNEVIRLTAREQLGEASTQLEFDTIAKSWDVRVSTYDQDLGRLTGWNAALEQNPNAAEMLAKSLSAEQIKYLAELTGANDLTTRYFATDAMVPLLKAASAGQLPANTGIEDAVARTLLGLPNDTPDKNDQEISQEKKITNLTSALARATCDISQEQREKITSEIKLAVANNDRNESPFSELIQDKLNGAMTCAPSIR